MSYITCCSSQQECVSLQPSGALQDVLPLVCVELIANAEMFLAVAETLLLLPRRPRREPAGRQLEGHH